MYHIFPVKKNDSNSFFVAKTFFFVLFLQQEQQEQRASFKIFLNYYSLITSFLFKISHILQDTFGFIVHPNQIYCHHIHRKVILLLIFNFETFGLAKFFKNVFLLLKSFFSLLIFKIYFLFAGFFCGTLVFYNFFASFFMEHFFFFVCWFFCGTIYFVDFFCGSPVFFFLF
jgi:hypothetical protein